MVKNCGNSSRTFKSAIIWVVADSAQPMREEARKLLAWQAIEDESIDLKLDDQQRKQLAENIQKARRDLKESIWRGYKHLLLLAKDNTLRQIDLGLVHSSAADSPIANILNRLTADGDVEKGVSPNFLVRNWPPAFKEWPTRKVRDDFFSSPIFPRLLNAESIKDTIARGIENGMLAYVGKGASGKYQPFAFQQSVNASDIEFSDDVFLITAETAQAYLDQQKQVVAPATPAEPGTGPTPAPTATTATPSGNAPQQPTPTPAPAAPSKIGSIRWTGDVPAQKWMNFYTKVLSRFATTSGLRLRIQVEVAPHDGLSKQQIEDTRNALRELGLNDDIGEG
jgi:hypothetical protein